jgi:hypothetical protein
MQHARGGTCRAARVLGHVRAWVVGVHGGPTCSHRLRRYGLLHAAAQTQHGASTSTAFRPALSMFPSLVGARDGSPSVELGERLRLCEHFERSGRR